MTTIAVFQSQFQANAFIAFCVVACPLVATLVTVAWTLAEKGRLGLAIPLVALFASIVATIVFFTNICPS